MADNIYSAIGCLWDAGWGVGWVDW